DLLRVLAVGDVLDVEVGVERKAAAKGKGALQAQIELDEVGQADRVMRAKHWLKLVAARVVEAADHRRPRHAAGVAEAGTRNPAVKLVARHHAEHVGLVEVKQARRAIRMILSLAARE